MFMKKVLFIIGIGILISINSFSQNKSETITVSIALNNLIELDFDNSTQTLGFTFASAADFDNGLTNLNAAGLRVKSNLAWAVSVKANTANFVPTSGGQTNVSASTLTIRRNGSSIFFPLSTTGQIIMLGDKGGWGRNDFTVDYIAKPGFIDAGTYTLGVTFTVSAL